MWLSVYILISIWETLAETANKVNKSVGKILCCYLPPSFLDISKIWYVFLLLHIKGGKICLVKWDLQRWHRFINGFYTTLCICALLETLWQGVGNFNLRKLSACFMFLLGSVPFSDTETIGHTWKSYTNVTGSQTLLTLCFCGIYFHLSPVNRWLPGVKQ